MVVAPSLIALDWGTSSLRASLLDAAGDVMRTRTESWGTMRVPAGDFAAAFRAITDEWDCADVPAVASGMIGSAIGWLIAPYCGTPVGADDLAAALVAVPDTALWVVPGVATFGDRPDVMRGEETQIVGALALRAELAAHSRLVLPGTHSKWVEVTDGRIRDFTTFMTGELFSVLRDHSILGRGPAAISHNEPAGAEAFARGVLAAQTELAGLAPLLFSARALTLVNRLDASARLEYLSGLLIGDEIRCGLRHGLGPSALIGDAALCARYVAAFALVGLRDIPVIAGAADAGLWSMAVRSGLVPSVARVT